MDYKLDFMSRVLQRTASKKIEHYVISRIWHLLDNYEIKMVPQQYVSRELTKYALTDIYFPQFKLHVEVNEPAHYHSDIIIEQDLKRKKEIEEGTNHKIFVIDCSEDIDHIHAQVDKLLFLINSELEIQISKNEFISWRPENEHNPHYWKSKGSIAVLDEISLNTIEDICTMFDADYRKTIRGFLRKGGIPNPKDPNQLIWWPSDRARSGWVNYFNQVEGTITETHINPTKASEHYNFYSQRGDTRIVFYHFKDILGMTNYKYVGVFKNDKTLSSPEDGTVWKIVGDRFNLQTNTFEEASFRAVCN
ncbi:AbaSI family restriction endonuclease [Pedobacter agri]|uniref:AbaSI family restriction endonuclease n=1 Tax=Pedobacter agri TaxID=454586 RepID=UPI002785D78D|nr:hypothetical protein [Pedobacter agri]MDQ1140103.1 hypothetical protein [Pedobacter agri]